MWMSDTCRNQNSSLAVSSSGGREPGGQRRAPDGGWRAPVSSWAASRKRSQKPHAPCETPATVVAGCEMVKIMQIPVVRITAKR